MKNKKRKGLLSILLVLTMCLTMNMSVFAAGTECAGGEGCVHEAAIGGMHYDTIQEAITDAASETEITLLKDATTGAGVLFNKEGTYTLNLNEKTLSSNSNDIVSIKTPNLALTIKNGNLRGMNADTYGIYAYNKGGTATEGDYANLNLTLDGVSLQSASQPVGVQGLNSNQNVTIKNSTITSNDVAIYFPPKSGVLTIDNSTVTGVTNGIVIKGGNLNIVGKNTVICATGPHKPQEKPYTGATDGGGFPETGDAIYIEGGYNDRGIDAVIKEGKIESTNAASVAINHVVNVESQKAEVEGGSFSSNVSQFVPDGTTSIGVTTGGTSTYYVGTPTEVVEKVAQIVKPGDTLTITKGNAELANIPDGVTVANTGAGDVSVNGDKVTVDAPVTSHTHTWGNPSWTWNGKTEATAKFVCTKDSSHTYEETVKVTGKTTPATCNKAGKTVYTASVVLDGTTYEDTRTVEIAATEQHTYQNGKCTVCGGNDPNYKPTVNKPATDKPAAKSTVTSKVPQTGDTAHTSLYLIMMLGAAGVVAVTAKKKFAK